MHTLCRCLEPAHDCTSFSRLALSRGEYTSVMRKHFLSIGLVLFAPLAFGQLDSNSVTVTASRGASLQADQAVFGVFVNSGLNAGLDDFLAALQGSGITLATFSSVTKTSLFLSVPPPNQAPVPMLAW